MSVLSFPNATLDDLMKFKPRAELINGRIVPLVPTGDLPSHVAAEISISLHAYGRQTRRGRAVFDACAYGFKSPLPSGRLSISPDASFFEGQSPPNNMSYIPGHPSFAVEVRSVSDFGPKMDREYEIKRNDYFHAGTVVVWDVDPLARTISKYSSLKDLTVFHAGEIADAEPALPGWRIAVDDLFRDN